MLTATDARNATVHGMLRKPSTKRSDVVKPTSKKPPTISQSHGMTILSLDEQRPLFTLVPNGDPANHRQHDRAAALPSVHGGAADHIPVRLPCIPPMGAGCDGGVRRCVHAVPDLL